MNEGLSNEYIPNFPGITLPGQLLAGGEKRNGEVTRVVLQSGPRGATRLDVPGYSALRLRRGQGIEEVALPCEVDFQPGETVEGEPVKSGDGLSRRPFRGACLRGRKKSAVGTGSARVAAGDWRHGLVSQNELQTPFARAERAVADLCPTGDLETYYYLHPISKNH